MAVKIRLTRTGRKNRPSFRIVATDSRRARDGKALEILGFFNPSVSPPELKFNEERLNYWRSVGAQISNAVEKLIEGKYKFIKYEPNREEKEEDEPEAEKKPNNY